MSKILERCQFLERCQTSESLSEVVGRLASKRRVVQALDAGDCPVPADLRRCTPVDIRDHRKSAPIQGGSGKVIRRLACKQRDAAYPGRHVIRFRPQRWERHPTEGKKVGPSPPLQGGSDRNVGRLASKQRVAVRTWGATIVRAHRVAEDGPPSHVRTVQFALANQGLGPIRSGGPLPSSGSLNAGDQATRAPSCSGNSKEGDSEAW